MKLIAEDAMALVVAAEAPDDTGRFAHRRAAARLDEEFNSLRRFGLGFVSVVVIVVGGFVLGLGVSAVADDGAAAAVFLVIGLAILVPGMALGVAVVRAGDRVRRAHAVWVADDAFGSPGRGTIIERLFSGRYILRSLLAGFSFLAAVFAWSIFGLALAPSDPIDMDGSQVGLATMGLIWAVAFTASTWYLFAGEVRMGWAHSRSVVRGL